MNTKQQNLSNKLTTMQEQVLLASCNIGFRRKSVSNGGDVVHSYLHWFRTDTAFGVGSLQVVSRDQLIIT